MGRSFYYRILLRLVDLAEEELDQHLLLLQRTQLIQETARLPELEYLFRHALTQDAAYSTILLKQRRAFHSRVGEALEALFLNQIEEMAGTLADHFFQARAFEKALHYYTQAGDNAFRLHAVAEAENHYRQALACAEKVEVESHQLVHLYSRRGRAFELNSQFEAALRNYQEMSALAAERQDEPLELASLTAQCVVRATQTPLYDVPQARALAEQALALVRKLDDQATEAKVLWAMLLVEAWGDGDNHKALEYGLRSLEIARELGLKEQMGFTLTNLINAYWNLNQLDAARKANLEVQAIWQELGNLPMLADAYTMKQAVHQYAGEFDAVLSVAQDGLRLSQSIGNLWNQMIAHHFMNTIYIDRGEVSLAIQTIANYTKLTEEAGFFRLGVLKNRFSLYLTIGALDEAEPLASKLYEHRLDFIPILRPEVLAVIILAKIGRGSLDQAQRILEEAYQGLDLDESAIIYTGHLVLAEIQLLLALEDPERALERASYLAERVRRVGFRQILPHALWLQGKACMALNQLALARPILLQALTVSQEIGERRIRWRILSGLAELEGLSVNVSEAEKLWEQAREVIDFIAGQTPTELRTSFLAMPDVRAIIEHAPSLEL